MAHGGNETTLTADPGIRARVEGHVRRLAGDIGERNVFRPRALAAAADYIEGRWREAGYAVTRQTYTAHGVACANLEAARAGAARADELLVVGAHYDSVIGSPGADDNASAVAALIEIARLFADQTPALGVRFVAFVNEEPPFFMTGQQGSLVYATAARERGEKVRLMVSLEMLGFYSDAPGSQRYPPLFNLFYPDRGDFIGFVSDLRSRRAMRRAAAAFRAHSDVPLEHTATFRLVPGVAWSDHWSFWRRGFRAFMVTDTAFYRNPHYHTAGDLPETLDYARLARLTEGLYRMFADLAAAGVD